MEAIHTKQGWQKVRKLSKWREVVPIWVYIVGAIISFIAVFIDNNRSTIWVFVLVYCASKWGLKEGHEEGYVEGWDEGQDYIEGDLTMDELLEAGKPEENDDNQSPTSDKSKYRK